MKRTKTKLVSSIVTLLVCFAMLVGSTFAWFTDTASTGVNTIKAGNLDIALEYYDGTSWQPVTTETELFDDSALWEPGHTEVAYLHIKNEGSLDLKYKMNVNVPSETGSINQKGEAFKLSDYLVFGKIDMASATSFYTTRDDARAAAGTTMGLSSWTKAGNLYANPIPTTAPSGFVSEEYVALVIYMPETVGNEANRKADALAPKIELGVNIVATQLNSESDSFGNDYDANADGNPDNGAAWTMAAFRAVADVPTGGVPSTGMEIVKHENDDINAQQLAKVTIPSGEETNAVLQAGDQVALSITPAVLPDTVSVRPDQAAFNYDIKLVKVASDNTETAIASDNNPVTVELNVGKGLTGLKIYHTSRGTTSEVSGVSYDSSTGIAKFTTTSFSDYTVVYNAKLTALNAVVVTDVPSLRAALNDGAPYIALGNDIDLTNWGQSESATAILNGEPAILDLNGYTIKGEINSGDILCSADETKLTIVDTSNDKSGQIISKYSKCAGGVTHLDGTECRGYEMLQAVALNAWQHAITIDGGTYLSNNVAINCQVQNVSRPEGVIINDGFFGGSDELIAGYNLPGPVGGCVSAVIGTVTINGGTFKAAQYGSVIMAESGSSNVDTVVNIYGGTFQGACMFDFGSDHSSKSIINVYGGDFTVKNPDDSEVITATGFAYDNYTHAALINNEMFELNIMGGTFNYNPVDYVATGYSVVDNANGTWTVVAE